MLTQMEVFTSGVTAPPLTIADQGPSLDAIQIKNIDGLGPVKATINSTQYGQIDGEFLVGTFTPKRNIVITAALNPDWKTQTLESLRQILYSYFMPENTVTLRFTSTHLIPVQITGVVESCELNMFSKDPEYVISIICTQPYFAAVNATVLPGVTQGFANPTDVLINYEGNANVGFTVDVTVPSGGASSSNEIRVINNTPTTNVMIVTGVTISSAQFARISSVERNKFIRSYPLPSGAYTNILSKLTAGSSWIQLRKGINHVQILTTTANLNYTLTYYARFGGL